jgi:signal transduction histidine kinase
MRLTRVFRSMLGAEIGGCAVIDLVAAVLLIGVFLDIASHRPAEASPAAVAGAILMLVPVAWRRSWPLAAIAVIAVATVLNGLIFGSHVRCGAVLPALFLVTFSVAAKCDRTKSAVGLLLAVGSAVAEGMYDPRIELAGLATIVPLTLGFFGAGKVVRARSEVAESLRLKSAELRRQREQTARLAVIADRAQISAELEQTLRVQLGGLATTATSGQQLLAAGPPDPAAAREILATIEEGGRSLLGQMRELVGSLREPAPAQPQPTLARLPELLATATTASAKLIIEGTARPLPAGLELSSYRIVEHLLQALEDRPGAVIDVTLRFSLDAIELELSGPKSPSADLRAVLAAAAERARLHNGSVQNRLDGRTCHAIARLPLISHA